MTRAGDDFSLHVGSGQLCLCDQKLAARLLTTKHQHWHWKRRCAQCGEVLRVLLEIFEILEAGAHAARLRVSFRIKLPVSFGDGMFSISREVVPEVLEISPLAALDQRQRHFA